ncbi:hypothetical protein CEXT_336361 [Caerostris extrusa]|uniref:Uncharacterized protein n=1 Tax=Caerostris extrusa TaxID=172846 RepID=A0AAV4UZT3_CAEEX|nr:hypothetical protein CEXT_336361 [Caerostris extrusa]
MVEICQRFSAALCLMFIKRSHLGGGRVFDFQYFSLLPLPIAGELDDFERICNLSIRFFTPNYVGKCDRWFQLCLMLIKNHLQLRMRIKNHLLFDFSIFLFAAVSGGFLTLKGCNLSCTCAKVPSSYGKCMWNEVVRSLLTCANVHSSYGKCMWNEVVRSLL